MCLLVGKAQVLIHKEPNVACFILSSRVAHKTLLVFVRASLLQHDSVCASFGSADLRRAGAIRSSPRQKNPEDLDGSVM